MCKYAIIDLEMCRVPKHNRARYHYSSEIIQIGAVLLNDEFQVADSINLYVKPEFGFIDDYIKKLTGIEKKNVIDSFMIKESIKEFLSWINEYEDVKIVSWSMSDRRQIQHELEEKNVQLPAFDSLYETWIDAQQMFGEMMGTERKYKLFEALVAGDIVTEGRDHDGLCDAYNTALLFAKMKTEPEFQFNDYYAMARKEETEGLTFSLGDLFAGLKAAG